MFDSRIDKAIRAGGTLSETPEWRALGAHFQKVKDLHMRDLFAEDPRRFERFSLRLEDMLVDFSKNRITEETLDLLVGLAEASGVREATALMFSGARINWTENRPLCCPRSTFTSPVSAYCAEASGS